MKDDFLRYLESEEAKLVALKPLSREEREKLYRKWWREIAHDIDRVRGREGIELGRLAGFVAMSDPTGSQLIEKKLASVRDAIEVERVMLKKERE